MPYVDPVELAPTQRKPENWSGVPGLTPYEHKARFRGDRYRRFIGPSGVALTTREFSWEQDISPKLDALRKQEEEAMAATAKEKMMGENGGGKLEDIEGQAIAHEAIVKTQQELRSNMAIANLFINNSDRISVVTNKQLPAELAVIAGVQGAERYFLIEEGSRADNLRRIFGPLRGLDRVMVDDIFHRVDVTPGHSRADFFGWKVRVGNADFVFLLNSEEAKAEDKEPGSAVPPVDMTSGGSGPAAAQR